MKEIIELFNASLINGSKNVNFAEVNKHAVKVGYLVAPEACNEDTLEFIQSISVDPQTRNTLDVSAVPVVKHLSHLPIIVDPSHAIGNSKYVPPLSMAAVAAGADGLIIEVHNNPACALCDGAQSLTPENFGKLMQKIETLRSVLK